MHIEVYLLETFIKSFNIIPRVLIMAPIFIIFLAVFAVILIGHLLKSTESPNVINTVLNRDSKIIPILPYKLNHLYLNKKLDVLFKITEHASNVEIILFTKKGKVSKVFNYTNFDLERSSQNKELNQYLEGAVFATEKDVEEFTQAQLKHEEELKKQKEKDRANWFLSMHFRSNNLIRSLFKTYETEPDKYYLAPLTSVESIKNYMKVRGIKTDIPDHYIVNAILLELERRKKSN